MAKHSNATKRTRASRSTTEDADSDEGPRERVWDPVKRKAVNAKQYLKKKQQRMESETPKEHARRKKKTKAADAAKYLKLKT